MQPQPPHDHFLKLDPGFIVASSTHAHAAFIPHETVKPGHTVVFPKAFRNGFTAMSAEESADLFALANHVARVVQDMVNAEKVYLLAVGDAVHHFHLHLLPKMAGEESLGPWAMSQNGWRGRVSAAPSPQEAESFLAGLKLNMAQNKV